MGIIILEAQILSFVRQVVLHCRRVSYRIVFVSSSIVRDADRSYRNLNSKTEHYRGLEPCYVFIYVFIEPNIPSPPVLAPALFSL